MLRVARGAVAILLAAVTAPLISTTAHAGGGGGGVVCSNPANPVCDPWVKSPGAPGGNTGASDNGGSGGGTSDVQCTYTPADLSAASVAALGGQPAGEGGWYFKRCYGPDGTAMAFDGPVWISGLPPGVSPEILARQARSRLRLPSVVVALNPAGDQIVQLPTWLALDPASWRTESATASVPGLSVTATARPVSASWSMGDGGSVRCQGPGTAWTPGADPRASSPDCGYTYQASSAASPGGRHTVTVTVTWDVTWAGAGQSGSVPGLTTTGAVQVRVEESQAVITR